MVSQVTEYLNITGSNRFILAMLRTSRMESCCHVHFPWFTATLGLNSPLNFPYIWSALVNLPGWMYVWEVLWRMKARKKDIFVERHLSVTMYCRDFSLSLHTGWCRHPSAGYIFDTTLYDLIIIRTIKYILEAILCKNRIWDQYTPTYLASNGLNNHTDNNQNVDALNPGG